MQHRMLNIIYNVLEIQVEIMSVELEEAKVQVAQFQKQCEDFLVIIVQQKREADDQQKV